MNNFGRYLRDLREKYNIPVSDLAKKIGIHSTYLLNIEEGTDKPVYYIVKKVVETLPANDEEKIMLYHLAGVDQNTGDIDVMEIVNQWNTIFAGDFYDALRKADVRLISRFIESVIGKNPADFSIMSGIRGKNV